MYAPPFRMAVSTSLIVFPVLMQFTWPCVHVADVNVPVTLNELDPLVGVVRGTVMPAVWPLAARWMCIPVKVTAGFTPLAVTVMLLPATWYETVPSLLLVNTAVPVGVGAPTVGAGISCADVMFAWKASVDELEPPQATSAAQMDSTMLSRMFVSRSSGGSDPPSRGLVPQAHFGKSTDAKSLTSERPSAEARRVRIHRHCAISHETAKCHARGAREIDGERAGGGNARHDGDSGRRGLLNDLEAGAPADQKHDGVVAGDLSREHQRADHLVDRVVPPDVLERRDRLQARIQSGSGMNATRPREIRLHGPQVRHRRRHVRRGDRRPIRKPLAPIDDVLDAPASAYTACRGRQRTAPRQRHPFDVELRAGSGSNVDRVAEPFLIGPSAVRHAGHVVARRDHSFRVEKPHGQLAIVSGRPHRDRKRFSRGPYLERLLDDDFVFRGGLHGTRGDAAHLAAADAFHDGLHVSFSLRRPSSSTTATNPTPQ